MAVGEVWRASVQGSHSGTELAIVTWHFRMLSAADPTTTIGLYLKTYWCDLIKTKMHNTFRWDQINLLRVNASPPISATYNTGFPILGQDGTEILPAQNAIVVKHATQYAGRSYRGRHYLPAMSVTSIDGGLVENAWRAAIQTYYDDIVAAVGSGGANTDIRWVVWSQKLLTYTDINEAVVRNVPGVIRRRRVGTGQ